METEVRIDMRHPSVNGTMSQVLHVEIAIIFVILMLLCQCLLLTKLYIPKFVAEAQVPYITDILHFFKWMVVPQYRREVSESGTEFLQETKIYYLKNAFFRKWVDAPP